jgi:hypothetical protein
VADVVDDRHFSSGSLPGSTRQSIFKKSFEGMDARIKSAHDRH